MHSLLTCLKCFKGFSPNKTHSEKEIDNIISNSIDPEEIKLDFNNFESGIPLETERNSSFREGTLNEYDFMSFGASSIKCMSERCSSLSDLFEFRGSRGISPNDLHNIPNQSIIKNANNNNDSSSCLVLKPPQTFSFSFVTKLT